jgi:hypothetical protein
MELHTMDEQQPTEKLVGRKGQTTEEKNKEHYR